MKASRKKIRNLAIVILLAVGIEIFVFNFKTITVLADPSTRKDIVYTINDIRAVNWEKTGNGLLSQAGPELYISGINEFVHTIRMDFNTDQNVNNLYILYTNNEHPLFKDLYIVKEGVQTSPVTLTINNNINDLRVDLGEVAGVNLHTLTVTINPSEWHISPSRMIAILLIYFGSVELFKLQRMPDYGLGDMVKKKKDEENDQK